jgi:hypothetical protein
MSHHSQATTCDQGAYAPRARDICSLRAEWQQSHASGTQQQRRSGYAGDLWMYTARWDRAVGEGSLQCQDVPPLRPPAATPTEV